MKARIMRQSVAATLATFTLGWLGLTMTDDPPTTAAKPSPPPKAIAVRLFGPASEITGVAVPAHIVAGTRPRFFQIDEPSVVTIKLPDRGDVTLPVKQAFINTKTGINNMNAVVVDVDLLPLHEAVPFHDAVAELRRLMHEMKIEPDDRMKKQMATWPDDSGPITYRTEVSLSPSVIFLVKVRPAPSGDAFFLALTFAADGDARRATWDPMFKSAPNPPPKLGDASGK